MKYTLASLAMLAALATGCTQQRAADRADSQSNDRSSQAGAAVEHSLNRAGETLQNSSAKAGAAVDQASEKLKNAWQTAKIKVNNANIDIDQKNGIVTLTGTVDSEIDKAKAEQEARKMNGVKQVINNIQVSNETANNSKPTPHGDVRKGRR